MCDQLLSRSREPSGSLGNLGSLPGRGLVAVVILRVLQLGYLWSSWDKANASGKGLHNLIQGSSGSDLDSPQRAYGRCTITLW